MGIVQFVHPNSTCLWLLYSFMVFNLSHVHVWNSYVKRNLMDFIQIVLNIVLLLLEERTNRIKLLYNYILGINYQIELVQYWKFLFSVRQTKGKIFFTCISKCWFAMYIVVIYPSEFNRRSYVWNKSGKRNYSNQTPGSDREGDW